MPIRCSMRLYMRRTTLQSLRCFPRRYVLHTVGPIIRGRVIARDLELLASCCRPYLALTAENDLDCNPTLTDTDAV